jgi:hypothetical protein
MSCVAQIVRVVTPFSLLYRCADFMQKIAPALSLRFSWEFCAPIAWIIWTAQTWYNLSLPAVLHWQPFRVPWRRGKLRKSSLRRWVGRHNLHYIGYVRCLCSASSVLTSPFPSFESAFNNLWANNADAVSILYSGTGALKTDFTRTGKRTYMGALNDGVNSVMRYVLNNFVDGRTQDAWDLFLGRYIPKRHHSHRSFKKATSTSATDNAEAVTIVTPLKAHTTGITPVCQTVGIALSIVCPTCLFRCSFHFCFNPSWFLLVYLLLWRCHSPRQTSL